jgi:hypothetical protein
MSDVCDWYLTRSKRTTEDQYVSLWSAISEVIHRQVWKVEQVSFITVTRSVNKQDLNKNLKFFNVTEASIESTYSKLVMRIFDVYVIILKCMYSTRFSGGSKDQLKDATRDRTGTTRTVVWSIHRTTTRVVCHPWYQFYPHVYRTCGPRAVVW